MKTCLLCNTDAPDDAVTCPNDGEASWSVADATPVDIIADATPVDIEPTKKRSRR